MNAKEALARTEAAAKINAIPICTELNEIIASAANQGKRSIRYFSHVAAHETLGIPLRHSLEEDGYSVRVANLAMPYIEVSW